MKKLVTLVAAATLALSSFAFAEDNSNDVLKTVPGASAQNLVVAEASSDAQQPMQLADDSAKDSSKEMKKEEHHKHHAKHAKKPTHHKKHHKTEKTEKKAETTSDASNSTELSSAPEQTKETM